MCVLCIRYIYNTYYVSHIYTKDTHVQSKKAERAVANASSGMVLLPFRRAWWGGVPTGGGTCPQLFLAWIQPPPGACSVLIITKTPC